MAASMRHTVRSVLNVFSTKGHVCQPPGLTVVRFYRRRGKGEFRRPVRIMSMDEADKFQRQKSNPNRFVAEEPKFQRKAPHVNERNKSRVMRESSFNFDEVLHDDKSRENVKKSKKTKYKESKSWDNETAIDMDIGIHKSKTGKSNAGKSKSKKPAQQHEDGVKILELSSGYKLKYEFLEDGDQRFGSVVAASKSRVGRAKHGYIMLEGKKLVTKALDSGVEQQSLFCSPAGMEKLERIPYKKLSGLLYKVNGRSMKLWSTVDNPPGIIGVFIQPKATDFDGAGQIPVTVICDNVRDSGNMGNIIRSAVASGADQFITTTGCVDVWDHKTLQAGGGSHFKIPIHRNVGWQKIQKLIPPEAKIFMLDNLTRYNEIKANSKDIYNLLSDETHEDENEDDDDDNEIVSLHDKDNDEGTEYLDQEHLMKYRRLPLATEQYYEADFTENNTPVVLIIAGESRRPSLQAVKLVFDRVGSVVQVDADDQVTANTGASIVLFEIRKQFLLKQEAKEKMKKQKK